MKKIDNLIKYREKRNFSKTPEPKGTIQNTSGHRYLIQKHEASHLHYDFRLELNGTLKSWAVPRGSRLDPHDLRLAMQVEDHPVSYASFEGIIPKSEYGGGTVMLWDEGTWEPIGNAEQGLAKGKLIFTLYGQKLQGEWTLVKSFSKDPRGRSWLLIKHKDEAVREGNNSKFLEENALSVASGRTMEEIASDKDNVWKSSRVQKTVPSHKVFLSSAKKTSLTKSIKKSKIPDFTLPQLATLSADMPQGKAWVHEIKFDGYRMISHINNGKVTIFSRNGKNWTDAFRTIADVLTTLAVENAIIDGEVVVLDADGKSDFSQLKDALSNGETHRFQYYVFDLLFLNGKDTTQLPLLERKALLQPVIDKSFARNTYQRVFFSEHFHADNDAFLQNICSLQFEGVVSKRADALYYSGRTQVWLKTKCQKRQEFVIGGFTLPSTGGQGVGSLLLGYYDNGALEYAGRVGTGFTYELSLQLRKKLEKLRQKNKAYISVTTEGRRGAIWVKPVLVAEVKFTEWTPDGHLRHPAFKGLREDKAAVEIVREHAASFKSIARDIQKEVSENSRLPKKIVASARESISDKKIVPNYKADKTRVDVAGVSISHPSRIIYNDTTITKQQLAEYYLEMSEYIIPHVINRPLSMLRCPEGANQECFFQRHLGLGHSDFIHEVSVGIKSASRDYIMIHDIKGLISLVQWGVIEFHPWQCKVNDLDKPDRIIFDLDPDPDVPFKQLIEAANDVRGRMEELGLKTFLKTTGGKGLHVVIPIIPTYSFPAIKSFTKAVAESMAHDHPEKYIAKMSKAARKGKIFVDYLRNDVTSTAVAAFSARARAGATVSTPLFWEELTPKLKLSSFTIASVPKRLKNLNSDAWKDFPKTKQKIDSKYLKALKITPE